MHLANFGVHRRFLAASLDSLDGKYFADVLRYREEADAFLRKGQGLLLSGPPGVGKTWAMVGLMKQLHATLPRFDFQMVTAPEMFERLYNEKADFDRFREQSWVRTYETVDALVINDLGKEDRSRDWLEDAVRYRLGRLLRVRNEKLLPIFITTNLALADAPQTLLSVYGESIWSLIYEMSLVRVQIAAPDRRRSQPSAEE